MTKSKTKAAATITAERLDEIAARIVEAPAPVAPLSVADAVRKLAPTIGKMRRTGHTLDSVATLLQAEGLQLSPQALSRHLRQASGKRRAPAASK
jgi:hypothetical protein